MGIDPDNHLTLPIPSQWSFNALLYHFLDIKAKARDGPKWTYHDFNHIVILFKQIAYLVSRLGDHGELPQVCGVCVLVGCVLQWLEWSANGEMVEISFSNWGLICDQVGGFIRRMGNERDVGDQEAAASSPVPLGNNCQTLRRRRTIGIQYPADFSD